MELRTLTGDLIAINRGMFVDSVALCCVPNSSTLEIFYNGREIELGEYKFYTPEHSTSKKLEVNILGIQFNFDSYDELRNLSQDVRIGDKYCRYSPSFYGFKNDEPLEGFLLEGINRDLPLNEDTKAVVFRFIKELYKYFYGRGFNLYDQKE